MKIALITLYPNDGGSTRVLLAAAEALRPVHDVTVHAPRADADDPAVPAFPVEPLAGLGRKLGAIPVMVAALVCAWRWLGRKRPDLVYVHDEPTLYTYGSAARLRGIPVLWHVHMRTGTGLVHRLRHRIASARITLTDSDACAPIPSWTVPNPVRALTVARQPVAGHLTLAVAATIQPRKNQATAIGALAALRAMGLPARLLLFGACVDGRYARSVADHAAALGMTEHVLFKGHADTRTILSRADIMLFPATYENQPLGLIEALIAGVPVVASDIAAHRAIAALAPGLHAMLAPTDPTAFAECIAAGGVTADAATRERLAAHFSETRFAQNIRRVIAELFAGTRDRRTP